MSCRKIQNSIIAGYTQSPLSDGEKKHVRSHLVRCARCREFAVFTEKAGIDPVSVSQLQKAPDSLWPSLREKIIKEQLERVHLSPVDAFFVRLEELILVPRMLVGYIAVFSIFFIIVLNLHGPFFSKKTPPQGIFAGHTGYFRYVTGYTTMVDSLKEYFYSDS